MGTPIHWDGLGRDDHVLQIYDEDSHFLDVLHAYVSDGLRGGEAVVVIASAPHREALRERLLRAGLDVDTAAHQQRYIALSAQDTLDCFMVGGLPDEALFRMTVGDVIARARRAGRDLRAFGEMVALLWARGNRAGATRLEQLWNDLLGTERFPLFCAYPRLGFGKEFSTAVHHVCAAHTRVFGV